MKKAFFVAISLIILVWSTGCSTTDLQEFTEGFASFSGELASSLDQSSLTPRPWTSVELAAWEEYKAAGWEDVQSTIAGIRITGGHVIESNPNLPVNPTEAQVVNEFQRVLRENWDYCNRHPEARLPFLRQQAAMHKKAAALNYEDLRRKGWINY